MEKKTTLKNLRQSIYRGNEIPLENIKPCGLYAACYRREGTDIWTWGLVQFNNGLIECDYNLRLSGEWSMSKVEPQHVETHCKVLHFFKTTQQEEAFFNLYLEKLDKVRHLAFIHDKMRKLLDLEEYYKTDKLHVFAEKMHNFIDKFLIWF